MTPACLPRFLCVLSCALAVSAVPATSQIIGNWPNVQTPAGNPTFAQTGMINDYDEEMLGKALFFDEQLSSDDTMACATCHGNAAGGNDINGGTRHPGVDGVFFTPDDEFGSPAMVRQNPVGDYMHDVFYASGRQATGLNTPTHINAAFFNRLFWDMRAGPAFLDVFGFPVPGFAVDAALEDQAVGPPMSPVEMAHDNRLWPQIVAKIAPAQNLALAINLTPDLLPYAGLAYNNFFQLVYGGFPPFVTRERIGMALAAYMRTLVSNQAPIDNGVFSLTPAQQNGFFIFSNPGRGQCFRCHSVGNLLIDAFGFFLNPNDNLFSDGQQHFINLAGHPRPTKTPTLRNVGLHTRFFSSGQGLSFPHMMAIQYNNPAQAPAFKFTPPLTPIEQADVIDFLQNALVDPRVAASLPPFDEPTLRSQVKPYNSNIMGAGTAGTGGFVPTMIANSPELVGNANFKVGVGTALAGSNAALFTSAGIILNQNFGGVIIHLDTATMVFVGNYPVNGPGPGQGTATAWLPIPNNPALVGIFFAYQWLVADPMAPGGQAVTPAATFTYF
jgi:cytochrome c peroxidase